MIHESSYWKDDLLKLASRLERRLIQTRWGEKNLYTLEKEIFIGFYSIRKLIESKKVSDNVSRKKYSIREYPYRGNPSSLITHFRDSEYDLGKSKITEISVSILCNQFIHSHHFLPFLPNSKNLIGFFFCSDHKRTTGLYLITLFDVVDIYRSVGNNYPHTIHTKELPNGKSTTTIE
ncbi:hypothetical protein EQ826_01205 [Ectopseudomonas mendocina]|nr:hypothetical protein [Pseudomonas mendocina]TRO18478.1 hypothetical protein EQ828_18545 [Pseudomonas mendocina]TRO29527.1 hypothetical protein EQ826_01205 [Pseudomonas mendocina]